MATPEVEAQLRRKESLRMKLHETGRSYLERLAGGKGTIIANGNLQMAVCRESNYYTPESADGVMVIRCPVGPDISKLEFPQHDAIETFVFSSNGGEYACREDDRTFIRPYTSNGAEIPVSSHTSEDHIRPRMYYVKPDSLDDALLIYARIVDETIRRGAVYQFP